MLSPRPHWGTSYGLQARAWEGGGGWLEGSWVSGSRFTWLAVTPGTLSEKASQNTSTAHHSSAHVVRGVGEVLARKHEAAYSKKSTRRSLLSLLAKIKCGMLADSQAADGFLEKHFYLWIQAFKNFYCFRFRTLRCPWSRGGQQGTAAGLGPVVLEAPVRMSKRGSSGGQRGCPSK